MGGLFKAPKVPAPPPPPPIPEPAPMPVPDDKAKKTAAEKDYIRRRTKSGVGSTILSQGGGGETLG